MSEDNFLDWFIQIALAIKHCHDSKILHRNLKSQNVQFSKNGTIKLGDFGIAFAIIKQKQLNQRHMKISLVLDPPELITETGDYSTASDIWHLGVILYEMAAL